MVTCATTLAIGTITCLTLYSIRKLIATYKWRSCKNRTRLDETVVIVTGANSGIGRETARELAKRGAIVVLASRDVDKCRKVAEEMRGCHNSEYNFISLELDLTSLTSIEKFVEEVQKSFRTVHILINNAGVYYPTNEDKLSQNGVEMNFATNYLGHFYLTHLLQSKNLLAEDKHLLLQKARVINVTSTLAERGSQDLNFKNWDRKSYSNSKLAQVYFNYDFAKRFSKSGIHSYAVCPGFTYTNLFRHHRGWLMWPKIILGLPIFFIFLRSAKMGAQTSIYCATEEGLTTGLIYRDCDVYKSKIKIDPNLSKQLWDFSLTLIEDIKKTGR